MPMPHFVQKQLIKQRTKNKFGIQKANELKKILEELPTYSSGPYAELRKWVRNQIETATTKSKVQHQDFLEVRKEGEAQICIVGPPNIGKSSLLKKITTK